MKHFKNAILILLFLCSHYSMALFETYNTMPEMPEGSDVRFVYSQETYSAGVSGIGISYYNGDPVYLSFFILRYLGDKEMITRQISSNALKPTVLIQITCCCGDDGSKAFENNSVYLNGHHLGSLNLSSNSFTTTVFKCDIQYLNWDTKNVGNYNEIFISIPERADKVSDCLIVNWLSLEIEAARPILFVPGYTGDSSDFKLLHQTFESHYGLPNKFAEGNNMPRGSIKANASALNSFVQQCKEEYGVSEISIIAHSKGGLDSRCYANEKGENGKDIKYILQIGTPNCGAVNCDRYYGHWHWLEGLATYLVKDGDCDALFDLQVGVVNDCLNSSSSLGSKEIKRSSDYSLPCAPLSSTQAEIYQMALSAITLAPLSYWLTGWLTYGHNYSKGRFGDGVVELWSAHFLGDAYLSYRGTKNDSEDFFDAVVAEAGEDTTSYQALSQFYAMTPRPPVMSASEMVSDKNNHTRMIHEKEETVNQILTTYDPYITKLKIADKKTEKEDELEEYKEKLSETMKGIQKKSEGTRSSTTISALGKRKGEIVTGTVKAGKNNTLKIDVIQKQAHFVINFGLFPSSIPIEITTPTGLHFSSSKGEEDNFTVIEMPGLYDGNLVWGLDNAPSGTYRVTFDGRNLHNNVDYALDIHQKKKCSYYFEYAIENKIVSVGEKFKLTVKVFPYKGADTPIKGGKHELRYDKSERGKKYYTAKVSDDGIAPDAVANDGIFTTEILADKEEQYHFDFRSKVPFRWSTITNYEDVLGFAVTSFAEIGDNPILEIRKDVENTFRITVDIHFPEDAIYSFDVIGDFPGCLITSLDPISVTAGWHTVTFDYPFFPRIYTKGKLKKIKVYKHIPDDSNVLIAEKEYP